MNRQLKRGILMALDTVMIVLSILTSALFMKDVVSGELTYVPLSVIVVIVSYLALASYLRIFSAITRFTSHKTLVGIAISLLLSCGILGIVLSLTQEEWSQRFLFLATVFSIILVVAPRMIWRLFKERSGTKRRHQARKRTLVAGAGKGGHLFIRTVESSETDIEIIGIIDGDVNKHGTYLEGKKVFGSRYDLPRLVNELEINQVTIAIPSLSKEEREKLIDLCNEVGVEVNTMPAVEDVISGKLSVATLKKVEIADLLGRSEVILNQDDLGTYFAEKTVLVTGAGGSIGSEICRQVSLFSPKRLLLLGHGENSIYQIHRELTGKYQGQIEIIPVIADIQDRDLIFEVMATYQPDIVYHAAAHKHVPLMEYNPREAVKNNIFGTKNVAEAAKAAKVAKFVMVSTDKAVNPPNVMGATKRVAEMVVANLNSENGTQFSAVRFGNVLGSRGSVVPLFEEQIAKGGPVTVTDFRMTRYFMTIPEASRLVIQSGYLAKGGEIFVLDMGEPVLIRDLAKKVIKLSGHRIEDIGIVETGIRPGEKLYEELLTGDELVGEQVHHKIFVGKVQNKEKAVVEAYISSLLSLSTEELKESLIAFAKQG